MANKDKLLESAQKFLAKGQLAKAIGEYQKLVEAFPKDYRNRQKLAELLSREKRSEEAQPHYEAVARNFTETGFYLKAIAIYKQMQKIEPNRVDIYLRLAELNEKQGLIGNALNEYRSLIAFYDKNRMARETIAVLQKMIALEPENLGVRGKLIETLAAVGEQEEARDQLRALVRLLAGKGEHGKVVKLYEKFLDLCPDDVDHRLPLAVALLSSGQAEKALALLKSLLKQAPDHPPLLLALTDGHLAVGNHADARLTCQHLLKEQPQDLELRERYLRICLAGADYERALECLEESKELFSQADRVGVLQALYEELQPAMPDNARLQATLAAIYEATGAAGAPPVFAAAGQVAAVEEVTADAAVLDAAISDVEQLDLVGEAVAPPVVVPTPPSAAKPTSGFELDLDLDLDLEASPAMPPPTAPAAVVPAAVAPAPPLVPAAASAPQPVVPTAPEAPALEMELEFDLGDLEGLEVEPPPLEPVVSSAPPEPEVAAVPAPELEPEPEPSTEPVVEAVTEPPAVSARPGAAAVTELTVADFSLADLGELEFEIEPVAEPELADDAAVAEPPVEVAPAFDLPERDELLPITPAAAESLDGAELTGEELAAAGPPPVAPLAEWSEFETIFSVEAAAGEAAGAAAIATPPAAPAEEPGVYEELEEFEELEELEDADEFVEAEEFAGAEELPEDEELAELEELDEVEPLEELDELDEFAGLNAAPPPVVAEALAVSPQQLRADLEEAEFYLRQGLFDDAERVVGDLQQRYAELPELTAKLAEIAAQRQAAAAAVEEGATFDLLADIKDGELLGAADFLGDAPDDVADEFSLAAAAEDDEDAQSHFDLGIAYKEMGLLDDAITEFGKALRDPTRQIDCLTLKGQCQIEMGDVDRAEATFKEGLFLSNLSEAGMVALRYELGLLYETAGKPLEALESFQIVADRDLFFRDVTDKLKSLRQRLGIDDQAIEAVSEGGGGRDRISFV